MSDGLSLLAPTKDDISKLIMSKVHLGAKNANHQMLKYVFKRRNDGVHVINVNKTWEKILLAARVIVAIENPAEVVAISGPTIGQRAVLKFAKHVGVTPLAGRFTPGTFTNQIQKAFIEPRLLIVTDPIVDHQAVREASYVNIPTIGLCDTDTPLRFIDIVIPANNKATHSVGIIWWMLARECLRFRNMLLRDVEWEIMPDLYFYRDPEEVEKEEQAALEAAQDAAVEDQGADMQWDAAAAEGQEWTAATDAAGAVTTDVTATTTTSTETFMASTQEWGVTASDWGSTAAGWDATQ